MLEEQNVFHNFNSVYTVLKFSSASNVDQRRDVLLFFSLFEHVLGLGAQKFGNISAHVMG